MNTLRLPFSALYRSLRLPGLLAALYVVTLLFTLPLMLGFRNVLQTAIGTSGLFDALLTQFHFSIFVDFMKQHGARVGALILTAIMTAFISVPVGSFLAGGIIATLRESDHRFSLTLFFSGCARYFGRFMRLLLIFAAVSVVLLVLAALLFGVMIAVVSEGAETEVPTVLSVVAAGALFALVFLLLVIVVDYAKVIAVETASARMVSVAGKAVRFAGKNFFRVLGIHLILLFIALMLVGVYWLLDAAIGMVSPLTIVIMTVVQQFFVLARMWMRVAFFSAELGLYQSATLREAPYIDTPPPSEEPRPLYA